MSYESKLSVLWVPVILGVIPCCFGYAFINIPWFRYTVLIIIGLGILYFVGLMLFPSVFIRPKRDKK